MPRPRKWRRVCKLPKINQFSPSNNINVEYVIMTVEEYETIRLMDLEKLSQEMTAEIMGVARSTVQRIYEDARGKLADCIVNGKGLKIEGGDYKLCEEFDGDRKCGNGRCHRRHLEK